MSSILTAFKLGSSDSDKSVNPPEIASSTIVVQTPDNSSSTKDRTAPEEKKPSPCCCCKETKQKRDACIVENGAENCSDLIEAHRICMKGYGYDV